MGSEDLIRMPQLGLTMTEGTLVEWLIEPGQTVAAGELLYVVETDKIANEITADRSGTFGKALVQPGETVEVGTVIGCWLVDGALPPLEGVAHAAPARPAPPPPAEPAPAHDTRRGPAAPGGRLIATPYARKLARANEIDLHQIRGSGPKGRIRGQDVLAAVAAAPVPTTEPAVGRTEAGISEGTRHPLSATQRTIATRMSAASRDVPHFYLTAEAEISELLHYHAFLKSKPGFPRLTLTHWIASAVGLVIASQGSYRTVYAGDEHIELADSDVGIAVATGRGLYAPVARRLGSQGLADNAVQIEALIGRARDGRLTAADLSGGAITVSNLGALNITRVFPIINPGQSSILGAGRTHELFRPDGDGQPALRREIGLVLACDHRVYNGVDGARLLDAIVALLEDPLLILANTRRS